MANPLALFPLEVWEMILDRVLDSETVYSLLQIFPQLDEAFQSKKHVWIFGKILPFITTCKNMLKEEELLKCRLACKNFLQQVDTFLENQQPHFRPYHPELQSENQFCWNSLAQFRQHRKNSGRKSHLGGVKLTFGTGIDPNNANCVDRFLREMGTHSKNRNPFLARSLSVEMCILHWRREKDGRVAQFLQKVLEVLERFGKHIWFYKVEFSTANRHRPLTRDWLTRTLPLLPNLKVLDLELIVDYPTPAETALEQASGTSAGNGGTEAVAGINFPSLESIRVSSSQPEEVFPNRILEGVTAPIRRLVLEFNFWRGEYSRLLSTVTEFKLEKVILERKGDWIRLRNLLLSLEAPQLVKLELKIYVDNRPAQAHVFIERDIFPWIKHFPSLKYLDIGGGSSDLFIRERGTLLPEQDSLPNLQFLTIRDNFALNYNFLRCLPSLKHLHIFTEYDTDMVGTDPAKENVVKIREQIERGGMHKSNIWVLLPRLKSVTSLKERFSRMDSVYDREKYNYFKEHNPDHEMFRNVRDEDRAGCLMWNENEGRADPRLPSPVVDLDSIPIPDWDDGEEDADWS